MDVRLISSSDGNVVCCASVPDNVVVLEIRDQADSDKGCGGRWHGQGRRTEGGGEGVGQISVKIILTAFCMHLTLFNQVQVDVHVEYCYIFS